MKRAKATVEQMTDLMNQETGIQKKKLRQLPMDEFQALFKLVSDKIWAIESLEHGIKTALDLTK